jgi:hypothetical protein
MQNFNLAPHLLAKPGIQNITRTVVTIGHMKAVARGLPLNFAFNKN